MPKNKSSYRDIKHSRVTQWDAAKYYFSILRKWPIKSSIPLFLTSFGTILIFFVAPLFVAQIIEALGKGTNSVPTVELLKLVGYVFMSMSIGEIFWRLGLDIAARFLPQAMSYVAKSNLDALLHKTMRFHSETFAGALVNKANRLTNNMERFYDLLLFNIFDTFIVFIFAALILVPRAPFVYFGYLAVSIIFVFLVAPLIKKRSKIVERRTRAETAQTASLADTLTNIAAVKSYSREKHELKLYNQLTRKRERHTFAAWQWQTWRIDPVISSIFVVTFGLALGLSVIAVNEWNAPFDTVFLTYTYIMMMSRKFWEFNRTWRNAEMVLTEGANALEVLRASVEINDPQVDVSKKIDLPKGHILMRNVDFSYEGDGVLFKKLNLEFHPGEKVGLVGPSGGGKTTITKLLLRFVDVTAGTITIDGHDIRDVTQSELRRHIAYVPQEPVLFHRTILENIRYGNLESTESEIINAARMSHADEFIDKLPQKYETLVGERGVKLSGGQRQRIAIARAMLRKTPILILDEATSALDSHSEKLIADALDKLMKGRTTVVIAHRLSTIRRMDKIIVLDKGRVVEEGRHEQLLRNEGKYYELWSHQSGDFLNDV